MPAVVMKATEESSGSPLNTAMVISPAMERIRVFVVDDSSTMRRIITDVLSADPEIEVVGTAANGRLALETLPSLSPDIMTLDIEMPEMDGLQTVPLVKQAYANLPIIMFSSLTERGAAQTLEALARGASDYVTKPTGLGGASNLKTVVGEELIGKIKALVRSQPRDASAAPKLYSSSSSSSPSSSLQLLPVPATPCSAKVVAIGVSTGGPNALVDLVARLPKNFGAPIVVVQHMPAAFTKMLAERLQAESELTVCEAREGQVLQAGSVYVAPGGLHMALRRGDSGGDLVVLNDNEPESSCRPAVDVLFRSVAELYRERALAVVLTGMGQDGLRGSQAIKASGGTILVQDQATSVVWGMPGAIVNAGLAGAVLPIGEMAAGIIRYAYGVTPEGRATSLR